MPEFGSPAIQSRTNPNLRASLYDSATRLAIANWSGDGVGTSIAAAAARAAAYLFNGSSWDRARANTDLVLLSSALRNASATTSVQTNHNARGVALFLDVTARTVGASPDLRLRIRYEDDESGNGQFVFSNTGFDPTVGRHVLISYPGAQAAAVGSYVTTAVQAVGSAPLPRRWAVNVEYVADITDLTYSLTAMLIL